MSKRAKVTFSLILVICLLLSGLPSAAAIEVDEPLTSPAAETLEVAEHAAVVTEEIPVLQLDADCQILSHVDAEVFAAGNHIARLPEEETLSSYVFLNVDGTKTVYYMDQPVKFENADGTVVEKNLTLTAATEGYTTTQNDIQLTIPMNPTNGIRLVYDNHAITLIPQGGTLSTAPQTTDSSVTYPDYYGEGMSLRYTPTLSGVTEDILLDAYSGVNSFTFRLNTGGLNLYQANGRYFLAESKVSTERIELGEVVTYDAKSKFSIGSMTAQTIMAGQAYMLTLTVDEAFLTDENTTYPVTIDPTLTVSYGNDGDNYIIDAPIFEGYPNNNYGAFQYNRVGYVDSSYQSGRTVVKLPVLTSSSIYSSLTADNITSVKFYVKEATGSSGINVSLYPLNSNSTWTETSVTWNNVGSRSITALAQATLTDSAWSAFDITTLVQLWKSGGYNANCGFIMIGASENSLDKSFCSSEHERTSYRPYVEMTYNSGISLNYSAVNVDEGKSFTITATTSPAGQAVTWTSSDESVATVSSSGVVTTLKAGEVFIRATKEDGTFSTCTVYVTVADGVYRISQSGLYLGTSGSISEQTPANLLTEQTSGVTYLAQLWKIKYISAGYYSIRPMHKLNMALNSTSGNVGIASDGGSDTLTGGSFSNRWGINYYNGKYVLTSAKSTSSALRCTSAYPGADIITGSYSTTTSNFHWTMVKLSDPPSGVILYDTATKRAVTNPTRDIVVGERKSLFNLNLQAVGYSASTNSTSFTWTTMSSYVSVNQSTGTITALSISDGPVEIVGTGACGTVRFTVHIALPDGVYFIRSRAYNRYIQIDSHDASNNFSTSGAIIEQWAYHGSDFQKWSITWRGSGYYSIVSAQSGMALTVPAGQTGSTEVSLVQEAYTGADRQLWKFIDINGRYKIKAKSAEENANDLVMTAGHGMLNDSNAVSIEQCQYTNDEKYNDEWFFCSIVDVGMSTDNYSGYEKRKLGSDFYAYTFYDQLTDASDLAPFTLTHHYNKETAHGASKTDFSVNGAISNNIDFMIYMGHGHDAEVPRDGQELWGNHIQYSYSTNGYIEYTDVCSNGIFEQEEINNFCLYTSEVRFGSSTSDLRWVWMYTCNFLNSIEDYEKYKDVLPIDGNGYVADTDLKEMMTGVHIIMGYATQSYLCRPNAQMFGYYLHSGMPIIDAFLKAGREGEGIGKANGGTDDHHVQKVMYIPQASSETIYSPKIQYEYDASDIRIITQDIQDDNDQ